MQFIKTDTPQHWPSLSQKFFDMFNGKQIWIGITKVGDRWETPDGNPFPVSASDWAEGQPTTGSLDKCAVADSDLGCV